MNAAQLLRVGTCCGSNIIKVDDRSFKCLQPVWAHTAASITGGSLDPADAQYLGNRIQAFVGAGHKESSPLRGWLKKVKAQRESLRSLRKRCTDKGDQEHTPLCYNSLLDLYREPYRCTRGLVPVAPIEFPTPTSDANKVYGFDVGESTEANAASTSADGEHSHSVHGYEDDQATEANAASAAEDGGRRQSIRLAPLQPSA